MGRLRPNSRGKAKISEDAEHNMQIPLYIISSFSGLFDHLSLNRSFSNLFFPTIEKQKERLNRRF